MTARRRIGVVAPGRPIARATADAVLPIAEAVGVELVFADQCFAVDGHFAGPDALRAEALIAAANDPTLDAVWFAAGGYGAARVLDRVLPALAAPARDKTFMGYSDCGFLLAALHMAGYPSVHGPMPRDVVRVDGPTAVERALRYLATRDPSTLEPSLATDAPAMAFNLTIFRTLIGTRYMPDLRGRTLMLEDVAEHLYAIDRSMFQIAESGALAGVRGVRLGRISDIPENDVVFNYDGEQIVRQWCARAGVAYLGAADIGHDAANKIVPFA